jgi:hypothetical protein
MQILYQSTTQIEGCPQLFVTSVARTGDWDVCSLAATHALIVYGQDTTDSHAEYTPVAEKNLMSAGQWVMYDIQYILISVHYVLHGQHVHESSCFSQTIMHSLKHMLIGSLQSGSLSWYSFHTARKFPLQKIIHKMPTYKVHVMNLDIFLVATALITGTTVQVW